MIVTPIKTSRITANNRGVIAVIDEAITSLKENSVLLITSKIVSLCENRVQSMDSVDKLDLIKDEAAQYTEAEGPYGFRFTVTQNTLIPSAGIDESNGDNHYILWPTDSQKTANEVRVHLQKKHQLKNIGVIITDSTSRPSRRGTTGIALAHSGFAALKDYAGTPDLFGRPFTVSQANIAEGLAAAAVVTMGEGTEQTPLCIVQDAPFVTFQDRNPSPDELKELYFPTEEDIFAPFLGSVKWNKTQSE